MASKKVPNKKKQIYEHKLFDMYEVGDVMCEIRYLNRGTGWLFPVRDGEQGSMVRSFIAYGKVNEYGEVSKL